MIKPKYKEFMNNYSQSGNILQSAIKAGFPEQYARKEGKLILNRAIKYHTQELQVKAENNQITAEEAKNTPLEILGLTRNQVVNRLKSIAMQDKDYSSALKVLMPVSKSIGYDISTQEQQNITVPVLNIVVDKPKDDNIIDIPNEELTK